MYDKKVTIKTEIEDTQITVTITEGEDMLAKARFDQDPEVFRLLNQAIRLVTE